MADAKLHKILQDTSEVRCVTFSSDSKLLASASTDKVRLWNLPNGELNGELEGHTESVYSLAFSPDGKSIVTGGIANFVRTWSVATKKQVQTLYGHSKSVRSVAWSPNGDLIGSGSEDTTVILWGAISGLTIKTLTGHKNHVVSVSFSQNGNKLASAGSYDKTAIIWDVHSGAALIKLAHSASVSSVCFSPDNQFVVTSCSDHIVRMFSAENGHREKRFEGHSDEINSVACSFDGSMIVSGGGKFFGGGDSSVRLWDVASNKQLQQLDGHTYYVYSVTFSRDGKFIASGSRDNTVRLWNAPSSLQRQLLPTTISPEMKKSDTEQQMQQEEVKKAQVNLDPSQVAEWSVEDVCGYFKQAKISDDVVEIFRQERIKGKSLASKANDDVLKSIGIKASGDREDVIDAINKLLKSSSTAAATTKGYDVFVSYRRSGGSELAYIITQALRQKGFNVFHDVGSLSVGNFEQAISSALKSASCVVVVMSPGALDQCLIKDEPEGKDWVRKEIALALKEGKQLLPVLDPRFTFPEPQELPEDMRLVTSFNGVPWSTQYPEAALAKLQELIKESMSKH